eukprot:TRINITY_DN32518_c0_g1_i1.p1 TRINITY_DN32518_c0_g1~~TRINITY_DN32518_c0_g1_i1.p1  ORF type:complete len:416 (-),score=83.60 TRINITY_DN32518_c0_g1_i1:261-1457(-)
MAIAALRRKSTAFKETAVKFASQLTAKTYEYNFNNELPKSVRILLEEDPEGMLQAARQEIDTGIPVVGERAKRHEKELKEAYERITSTAKPIQEVVVINEQVKKVSMRSPMVRCSIAICEWNGALKIVMVKAKIMSTSLPITINKLQDNDSKATLVRADSLEQALESFGLQIGFDKQASTAAESEVETNSSVETPSNRAGQMQTAQLAQQEGAKQMSWQMQPPTLLQTSQTAPSQTLHQTPKQTPKHAAWEAQKPSSSQMQQHTPRHGPRQMPTQAPVQSPRQDPQVHVSAADMALLYGGDSPDDGQVQVAPHSREAQKPGSSPWRLPLPDGFLPVEGDVKVYSVSQKQWVAGKLRGLGLGKHSSSPAGSVCVEYEGALRQMTQKVVLAKQLPDMIRT